MKFRFDENDDLVVDDIPDDLMADIECVAARNGRSVEDEMRVLVEQLVGECTGKGQTR